MLIRCKSLASITLITLLFLAFPQLTLADATVDAFLDKHRSFFNLLYPEGSDFSVSYRTTPGQEEDGGPGEFDLHNFAATLDVALPVTQDFYINLGGTYDIRAYDFKNVSTARTNVSSETLHKIVVHNGIGIFVNEDLLLKGQMELGLFSDLDESIDEESFDVLGHGMAVYQINPWTQLVGGAALSRAYDDYPVIPLLGFRVQSDDAKIHFSLTAPIELRVGYRLNQKTEVYAGAWASGEEYRMDAGRGSPEFDLNIRDRKIGGGVLYWTSEAVSVGAEAGSTVGSDLEFDIANAGQYNEDLKPGIYMSAKLGYSF